jgi:hypothetical protein
LGKNFADILSSHTGKPSYAEHITPEHLTSVYKYATSKNQDYRTAKILQEKVASHPNVTEDILADARERKIHTAFENPKTTSKHIEEFFEKTRNTPESDKLEQKGINQKVLHSALENPNFPKHMFDSIINFEKLPKKTASFDPAYHTREFNGIEVEDTTMRHLRDIALYNPSLPQHHFDEVLGKMMNAHPSENSGSVSGIVSNPAATDEHVKKAIKIASIKGRPFVHAVIGRYDRHNEGNIPEHVFDSLLQHENGAFGEMDALMKHKQFSKKHLDYLKKKYENDPYMPFQLKSAIYPEKTAHLYKTKEEL